MTAATARAQPLPRPGGPPAPAQPTVSVLAHARSVTRRKASTFSLACRLLPRQVRDDVYLLYLVLRTLDDLVDEADPAAEARVAAVEAWASAGSRSVATLPGDAAPEVGLLETLDARHPLPRPVVADFCAGMRQDLARARFRTEAQLDTYCYQVAGTVGVLLSSILGVREPSVALPAAAALGMAMQRTNILRDIDEDLAAGRLFLAEESIERHGPPLPGGRSALVRDGIARADALYETGMAGLDQLVQGRRAVAAAATMYREILREIERRGADTPGRAIVSRRRKLALVLPAAAHA
jgi:phytoene synthase